MPKKEIYKIEYLKALNSRISQSLEKLGSSTPDIDSIARSLYLSWHPRQVAFDLTVDGEYMFYGVTALDNNIVRKADSMDRIFNWNYGRDRVYKKMKSEINYRQLLELQNRYYQLYKLIIKNNPENTNYDTDISFDTPFLEYI